MKNFKKIVPALIMIFGLIHISFAFPLNDLEIDTLLFIGAGLAIVFAGVINLLALTSSQSIVIKFVSLTCNAIMFSLFVVGTSIMMEPQIFIGIFLFLISTLFAIADLSTSNA